MASGARAPHATSWVLEVPPTEFSHPPESTKVAGTSTSDTVIVPGVDHRTEVENPHFEDGGKYRSIVKVFSRFHDPSGSEVWMMGTGWLVRPDLLVTAGNVVYDWEYGYKFATQIKCYIGYSGRDSVRNERDKVSGRVQARFGLNVATTSEWIAEKDRHSYNVAFIQLDKGFNGNLRNFAYRETSPNARHIKLGIVGYPGDQSLVDSNGRAEIGQSGTPILHRNRNSTVAIGTHCYSGYLNSGNSIGGEHGNDYTAFESIFTEHSTAIRTPDWPKTVDPRQNLALPLINPNPEYDEDDSEGFFFDILWTVASVGSDSIPVASCLLGPVGAAVSAAGGGLLGALAGGDGKNDNGSIQRAILAEAAFQSVLQMPQAPEYFEITRKMNSLWPKDLANIDPLARALAPVLIDCGLNIASSHLETTIRPSKPESDAPQERQSLKNTTSGSAGGNSEFVEGLFSRTKPLAGGKEGILTWLGQMMNDGLSASNHLLSPATQVAIDELSKTLIKSIGHSESAIASNMTPHEKATRILLRRAMVAESALQALMSFPKHMLQYINVVQTSSGEGEGIFDFIKTTAQKFGPVAMKTAQSAAAEYLPTLIQTATTVISTKLDLTSDATAKMS